MVMNATVLWVRHAPTHTDALVGWTDIEADFSDQKTIRWLHNRLPIDAVVVASDLKRASATADAITQERMRLADSKGLREIYFGDWEGKTANEIAQSHPKESGLFWSDPKHTKPPNGESWQVLTGRAGKVIDQSIQQFPNRTIVAVSHFGTIVSQALRAENAKNYNPLTQHVSNLSVTEMTYAHGKWRLVSFSELPTSLENPSKGNPHSLQQENKPPRGRGNHSLHERSCQGPT